MSPAEPRSRGARVGVLGQAGCDPLPAAMERGCAELLPLHAQSLALRKGSMRGGLHSAGLRYLGVKVSRSQQQLPVHTHPVPSILPGYW